MIGVLAVIGILAALLVPKIFDAINSARINSGAVSIATIKTAVADHYAKFGTLQSSNGVTFAVSAPVAGFDGNLVNEQILDKILAVKIADPTNTVVELVPISTLTNGVGLPGTGTASGLDWGFALAGTNATTPNAINSISGTIAVVCVLSNVLEADAQALNLLIDGPQMAAATLSPDLLGRVKYSASAGGLVNMTIYITHR